jgi:hypothetical protein
MVAAVVVVLLASLAYSPMCVTRDQRKVKRLVASVLYNVIIQQLYQRLSIVSCHALIRTIAYRFAYRLMATLLETSS